MYLHTGDTCAKGVEFFHVIISGVHQHVLCTLEPFFKGTRTVYYSFVGYRRKVYLSICLIQFNLSYPLSHGVTSNSSKIDICHHQRNSSDSSVQSHRCFLCLKLNRVQVVDDRHLKTYSTN